MEPDSDIEGVKQNASGYSDAETWNNNWKGQSDAYWDSSLKEKGMRTMGLWGLSDEAARVGGSVKDVGWGGTLTGKGNLGGFRSPVLDKAGKAMVNPSVAQRLNAQPLNTTFAGLNIASGLSAGYREFSGADWNPYTALFDKENFGKTEMEDDEDSPMMDKDGNPVYQVDKDGNDVYYTDDNGEPILDEDGKKQRLPKFNQKSRFKGVRTAANNGSMALGIGEAVIDDLSVGGWDAFQGNHGFADLADMFGLGGDWAKETRRNAQKYVADRQGIVDTDPLGVGGLAERTTGRVVEIIDDIKYPKSEARIESEKKPYGPSPFPKPVPMGTPRPRGQKGPPTKSNL